MSDSPQGEVEDRLVDLEIRLSHQEVAIEQLTRQLLDSEREVRQLQLRLDTLEQQMRAVSAPDLASPHEETPPPHY